MSDTSSSTSSHSGWVELADEAATVAYGRELGARLLDQYQGDALVFLHGQLGAGKTTLVRGVLNMLGHTGAVKSPTYTLLEPYSYNGQDAFHFDLYRVADAEELAFVGFDEIIDGPGIKLIEWPEKADSWLPAAQVEIYLQVAQQEHVGDQAGEKQTTEAVVELGRVVNAVYR